MPEIPPGLAKNLAHLGVEALAEHVATLRKDSAADQSRSRELERENESLRQHRDALKAKADADSAALDSQERELEALRAENARLLKSLALACAPEPTPLNPSAEGTAL